MTRHIAFALAGCLALVGACQADQISGDFTILNGALSPSGGLVTFTLNGDGTISASMVSYGDAVQGFGFDSVLSDLPESNFSPTAVDNAFGWSDMYGAQLSGFYCSACGLTETWTIGTTGEFSSVFDALAGGNSTYPLFFYNSKGGPVGGGRRGEYGESGTFQPDAVGRRRAWLGLPPAPQAEPCASIGDVVGTLPPNSSS